MVPQWSDAIKRAYPGGAVRTCQCQLLDLSRGQGRDFAQVKSSLLAVHHSVYDARLDKLQVGGVVIIELSPGMDLHSCSSTNLYD